MLADNGMGDLIEYSRCKMLKNTIKSVSTTPLAIYPFVIFFKSSFNNNNNNNKKSWIERCAPRLFFVEFINCFFKLFICSIFPWKGHFFCKMALFVLDPAFLRPPTFLEFLKLFYEKKRRIAFRKTRYHISKILKNIGS